MEDFGPKLCYCEDRTFWGRVNQGLVKLQMIKPLCPQTPIYLYNIYSTHICLTFVEGRHDKLYSYAHESMSHTHITIHIISRLSGDMKTRQVSCSSSQQCTYVVYCLCWWVKKAQGKIRHWHNKCRPAWHAIIAQGMQKEKWLWSSTITTLISWKWSMIFDNKKKGGGHNCLHHIKNSPQNLGS